MALAEQPRTLGFSTNPSFHSKSNSSSSSSSSSLRVSSYPCPFTSTCIFSSSDILSYRSPQTARAVRADSSEVVSHKLAQALGLNHHGPRRRSDSGRQWGMMMSEPEPGKSSRAARRTRAAPCSSTVQTLQVGCQFITVPYY
eukprot:768210-Hanusia_phi.AAC.4